MIGSERMLAERYDVALLDLDGVVYLGEQPVDGVAEALAKARAAGMRLAFVTNNASRTPAQVAALLDGMGVPADPAEVVTSAQAAAHYLADRLPAGSAVLVLGTTGLIEAVSERGLRPVFSADEDPAAVVQGFFQEICWKNLAEGMVAIGRGLPWLATNLDSTVPSPRGALPGNGALVAALRHATGVEPAATGKPDPTMHAESVERSGAKQPIVVGDRLDTDIEGASRVGCPSLLVLSGVTTAWRLLTAIPAHRPDYLGQDVSALLQPHPAVRLTDGRAHCGGVTARRDGDQLVLSAGREGDAGAATPDGLDPVRALAVLGWWLVDAGVELTGVRGEDDAAAAELARLGLTGDPRRAKSGDRPSPG